MNLSLFIVVFVSFIFFISLVLIYGYLVVRKIGNQKNTTQKQQWIAGKRVEIEQYLISGASPDAFIPRGRKEYEALEGYFSHHMRTSKDPETMKRVEQFVSHHFLNFYRRRLHSRSWSQRMNTLYYIEEFKLSGLQAELLKLLEKKHLSVEERSQIYLILSTFQYEQLFDMLLLETDMPTFICRQVLQRLLTGDNYIHYMNRFEELPLFLQMNIIDVLSDKNIRSWEFLELLEKLMRTPSIDHELLIRVLKSVAHFGYLKSSQLAIELANRVKDLHSNQSWLERLMLSRVMGSIRKEEYLPYLEQFISDPTYLVRNEAARSLLQYRTGRKILNEIAATNKDPYAREIAEEWLERSPEDE